MKKTIYKIMITTIAVLVFLSSIYLLKGGENTAIAATTESQPIKDGIYTIQSALNEKYVLDISAASKADGGNIQLWSNADVEQQRFKVKYLGSGYYSIISVHSGKAVDVSGSAKVNSTNVQQWGYAGVDAQKWTIKDAGNGYFYITSKLGNLCLNVQYGSAKNGANIEVYQNCSWTSQKFKFVEYTESKQEPIVGEQTLPNGTYVIKSALNENYVLDVSAASKAEGGNIQLWSNANAAQQRFKVTWLENGYYSIVSANSDKSMSVAGGVNKNSTNVQQWSKNDSDAEKWIIKDAGKGYYYIISKLGDLCLNVQYGSAKNGANIEVYQNSGWTSQKFKFEEYKETPVEENPIVGEQTIPNGTYFIKTALNPNFVLDISAGSKENGANLQLWGKTSVAQQKFKVNYLGDGYYTIKSANSSKMIDVASGSNSPNVRQWENNDSDSQKWIIKDAGNDYFYIISKRENLCLNVQYGTAKDGANIEAYKESGWTSQKFKFEKCNITIDESRYPGYSAKIQAIMDDHPNWNFELLYTGLSLDEVVSGEAKVHSRNLVPSDKSGEWICSVCGTKPYDSGWYCASEKATAYYMDPRNFLDEINIFQFQDVNEYIPGVCTLEGIQNQVNNTYLRNYANDIDTACRNQNVNPYYIISRLIQEQGKSGTQIGRGMDGGDGNTYYNPFNIGASGNGWDEIYANALATAKSYGWNTMEKALEGGITFCKANWLENYQNTLYQNKFDIDTRNGTALYVHQYMQNLMGAYSEAQLLQGMYANTDRLESNFTFIIPVYENMSSTVSQLPSNSSEIYPMDVETTGTKINVRAEANTSSRVLTVIVDKGTKLLSIERGINSNWQKIILTDGTIGYVSGTYLKQIDDQVNCNEKAKVKTNDGYGCNTRLGPSLSIQKGPYLDEAREVTIINKGTYNNIDGFDWYRIKLSDGRQAFIPSRYLQVIQ